MQPPQYAAHPSMQPTGERPRKVLAIVAIAFAALAVLVGPVQGFVTMGLISSGMTPTVLGVVSAVMAVASGVLSLGALGFGLASLLRRERPRVLAGAAIGIGIAGLVGLLSVAIQTMAYAAL